LTKRLVEAQGGSVGARSVVGVGSTFFATLPRQTRRLATTPAPSDRRPGPAILVVEDNPEDAAYATDVLTAAGYEVECAARGAAAARRCRERAFDAILLDLLLPDRSGVDVLHDIRSHGLRPDAPVIVASVITERSALAGLSVSDFLPKPVTADGLLRSLRRAGVPPHRTRRVLIVDDDEVALRLLAVTLERLGFSVEARSNPVDGLASAAATPPAVIVLDLLMPGLDGFEFLEGLRRQPANRTTPVIVWTVKELTLEDQQRLPESAVGVLLKGADGVYALVSELRTLLRPASATVSATNPGGPSQDRAHYADV
jgi:CheY-like chemotaxis protein